jgi:hypothetical protein
MDLPSLPDGFKLDDLLRTFVAPMMSRQFTGDAPFRSKNLEAARVCVRAALRCILEVRPVLFPQFDPPTVIAAVRSAFLAEYARAVQYARLSEEEAETLILAIQRGVEEVEASLDPGGDLDRD